MNPTTRVILSKLRVPRLLGGARAVSLRRRRRRRPRVLGGVLALGERRQRRRPWSLGGAGGAVVAVGQQDQAPCSLLEPGGGGAQQGLIDAVVFPKVYFLCS
jgi:hypothetical protein